MCTNFNVMLLLCLSPINICDLSKLNLSFCLNITSSWDYVKLQIWTVGTLKASKAFTCQRKNNWLSRAEGWYFNCFKGTRLISVLQFSLWCQDTWVMIEMIVLYVCVCVSTYAYTVRELSEHSALHRRYSVAQRYSLYTNPFNYGIYNPAECKHE